MVDWGGVDVLCKLKILLPSLTRLLIPLSSNLLSSLPFILLFGFALSIAGRNLPLRYRHSPPRPQPLSKRVGRTQRNLETTEDGARAEWDVGAVVVDEVGWTSSLASSLEILRSISYHPASCSVFDSFVGWSKEEGGKGESDRGFRFAGALSPLFLISI